MHNIYPIDNLPRALPLCLGVQSEYGARPVSIDVTSWVKRWPDIVVSVQPVRPGEDASYPATDVTRDNNVVTWTPNAYDTEIPGTGNVEIVGLADGVKIIRTGAATSIAPTMTYTSKEPEEPVATWADSVIKAGEQAKMDADRAEAAADTAAEKARNAASAANAASMMADAAARNASVATEAANEAKAAAGTAETHRAAAEAAARAAEDAADRADTSADAAKKAEDGAASSATSAKADAQAAAQILTSVNASALQAADSAASARRSAESAAAHDVSAGRYADLASDAADAAEAAKQFAQGAAEKGWMYVEGRDDGYLYLITSDNAPAELTLKDDGQGRLVAVYG